MKAFQVLGIPIDADVVSIKRAYAKLLRLHRPDEDPVGFQRVHEAYQACLAHAERLAFQRMVAEAQQREQELLESDEIRSTDGTPAQALDAPAEAGTSSLSTSEAATPEPQTGRPPSHPAPDPSARDDEPHKDPGADRANRPPGPEADDPPRRDQESDRPRARPATAPPGFTSTSEQPAPKPIQFPLTDFVDALCEQDRGGQVVLRAWLQQCEPLYSLGLKQAITAPMLQILAQRRDPLSPDGLRVVLNFFALDTVSPERRALEGLIQVLESRTRAAWSIRQQSLPTTPKSTGNAAKKPAGPVESRLNRFVDRELTAPYSFWRRAFVLLFPGLKGRMRLVLDEMDRGADLSKDAIFARGALPFWRRTLDPTRVSPWRVASMGLNLVAMVATAAVLERDTSEVSLWGVLGATAGLLSAWLLLALHRAATVRKRRKGISTGWAHGFVVREFRLPRRWTRRIAILLIPGLKGQMRATVQTFPVDFDGTQDPRFDAKALAFWRYVLDRAHVSAWRVVSMILNLGAIVSLAWLVMGSEFVGGIATMSTICFCAWFPLVINDAHKLRRLGAKRALGGLDPWVARELRKPRRPLRRAAVLLLPGLKARMRRILLDYPKDAHPPSDPGFDHDALRFWRHAMDPARVSGWRIFSSVVNAAVVVLAIYLLTGNEDLTLVYAVLGATFVFLWLLLAANNARDAGQVRLPMPAAEQTGPLATGNPSARVLSRGRTGSVNTRGGISPWRWIIWIVIAINALMHMLSQS